MPCGRKNNGLEPTGNHATTACDAREGWKVSRSFLARGPVGRFVVAGLGELARFGAVGQHAPNLALAGARGFEDDVAAVGRPTGAFVTGSGVGSDVEDAEGARNHDVDVIVAIREVP